MANTFLQEQAVEYFDNATTLLNVFGTRVVGVDEDIVAEGDSLKWTELDRSKVGDGVITDGQVTTWGRPALSDITLTINKELGIAFRVLKKEAETNKRFNLHYQAEIQNKVETLEGYVFAELVAEADAFGGTDLSPTDGTTNENLLKALAALESKCVRENIPADMRVLVASPELIGSVSVARLLTKVDAYVEVSNYAGHFGTLALYSWTGIEATESGNEPVYFGYKNAIVTGVLIDSIYTDDNNVLFPDNLLCSGTFNAGVKAIKGDKIFKTYIDVNAVSVIS